MYTNQQKKTTHYYHKQWEILTMAIKAQQRLDNVNKLLTTQLEERALVCSSRLEEQNGHRMKRAIVENLYKY